MRLDLALAEGWIAPGARVLDLGCGDGELLAHLRTTRQVYGYGMEIDPARITGCIRRGVNVIEQDLNKGLANIRDGSFDVVIMTQAIQAVRHPDFLLREMLRVGREAIVTFPNFAHWRTRYYLAGKGMMPMSEALPYNWYDTPNIHLCTFSDFDALCRAQGIRVVERHAVNGEQESTFLMRTWPNLFGEVAIYRLAR